MNNTITNLSRVQTAASVQKGMSRFCRPVIGIFLGLAITSLSPDREVPMMVVVFSSLPLLFRSGFSWPPEAFPSWLRAISWFVPTTAGIDDLLRINQIGARWQHVASDWLVLCDLICLYFPLACWSEASLRRRYTESSVQFT